MAYCMVCKSLLLYASIAVEASPRVALFYRMYVSSMLLWRHSMQYFVLTPIHITLHKYGCIYHQNVSRYIYISEEYYGSEGVTFLFAQAGSCNI
jgi:hypothetical protein